MRAVIGLLFIVGNVAVASPLTVGANFVCLTHGNPAQVSCWDRYGRALGVPHFKALRGVVSADKDVCANDGGVVHCWTFPEIFRDSFGPDFARLNWLKRFKHVALFSHADYGSTSYLYDSPGRYDHVYNSEGAAACV